MKVDFSKLLISVIHGRDFKASNTYPFSYTIFQLCRDTAVTIWHRDVLRALTRTVDIGLITEEANEATPWRGPKVDVKPLGENLGDTVEQSHGLIMLY